MFQFDKSIDVVFMESMYDNDFTYIEELFNITLDNYDVDAEILADRYKNADLRGVQKAIHKMKSVFGFIGMLALQNNCQEVETKCSLVSSVAEIKDDIETLKNLIQEHKLILQKELTRLKMFNNSIA